jgi:hypothetical protein
MKNRNNKVTAVLFVVALALAPMVQATPSPGGGPSGLRAAPTPRPHPSAAPRPHSPVNQDADAGENSEASAYQPVITIHSTDNVSRGKIGTFVLNMKPALMLGGTYVNFSLSGTAAQGVDYVVPVSPAYISQSGYGVIQIQTLPDLRGGSLNQAYSVVITLNAGAGYKVGKSNSAIMWIKPAAGFVPPNS